MPKAPRETFVQDTVQPIADSPPPPAAPPVPRRPGRPRKAQFALPSRADLSPDGAAEPAGSNHKQPGLDLSEKIKDLLRLAKEQGHLTYDDVSGVLPDEDATPDDLDHVLTKLRDLEID